jgi:hypothetical protein
MVLALEFPVLDADSHLFKTEDKITRYLPIEHTYLFQFVEVRGRKTLLAQTPLTDFIPIPSFEVVAGARCHMASMDSRAVRRITSANMFDRLVLSTPSGRSAEHGAATVDP